MARYWRLFFLAALSGVLSAQQSPVRESGWNASSLQPTVPGVEGRASLTPEQRGDIYMARKMYREAVDMYRQGDATSCVLANKIGIAYHHLLELGLAKRQYERSSKIKPDYSEAINNLGTIHYAQKSYRRAISQYKKALKVAPQSASIWSNLGTAYFARKKYEQAAESYEHALSLDPEVFERRSGQGGSLLQERSVLEKARFHFYLSKTYAKAGHTERALLYMRKALEEGFPEKQKFKEAPEFAAMQELPEFQTLLAAELRVL